MRIKRFARRSRISALEAGRVSRQPVMRCSIRFAQASEQDGWDLMRIKDAYAPSFQQCGDECHCKSATVANEPLMDREIVLDVRGMEPPEPLERVLETVDGFASGDRLKLIIDCHPLPLFRILERNGFAYREAPGVESVYEITIWRKD